LYEFLDVSTITQDSTASVLLIITQRGWKFVNTKGPSALPLPV
jgi:hypothetical protein